MYHYLVRE